MLYPLKFKPVFKDYIWGGRNLEKLNKKLPLGNVAESWEISCHKDGMSIIENGVLVGKTLEEVVKEYGEKILGTYVSEKYKGNFTLLVKFIDANKDLSVQVHPDDEYARLYENGENGKNEMWYVVSCRPGAKIVYGLKENVTKDEFIHSISENRIEECLNYVNVSPGDAYYIPAGTIHAIGEGILIAEIQQSSNLTYRVYDYERVDKDGNKRDLHIARALQVINFNKKVKLENKEEMLYIGEKSTKTSKINCEYFNVDFYDISEEICEITDECTFEIYVVIEGSGKIYYGEEVLEIGMGDSVLISAGLGEFRFDGKLKMLKIYVNN